MTSQPCCKKCGKPLTDPASIRAGLGPECRGQGAKSTARRLARASRRAALLSYRAVETSLRDVKTKQPIVFQPDSNGYYRLPSGALISSADLENYLVFVGQIEKEEAHA